MITTHQAISMVGAALSGGLEFVYGGNGIQLIETTADYDDFTGAAGSPDTNKWTVTGNPTLTGSGECTITATANSWYTNLLTGKIATEMPVGGKMRIKVTTPSITGSYMFMGIADATPIAPLDILGTLFYENGNNMGLITAEMNASFSLPASAWSTDTAYYLALVKATGDVWYAQLENAAGAIIHILGASKFTSGVYAYMAVYGTSNQVWTFGEVTYSAWSSSAETATLAAIVGAATYDTSTLDFPVIIDGSRAAPGSTDFKVRWRDGAGAWSAYYTVTEFRALPDIVITTSLILGLQIDGDGTQEIVILRGQIDATVSAPAGAAPGQATITVTHDSTTSSRFAYTFSAGSGTVSSNRLYFRKTSSGLGFTYSAAASGYRGGLSEGVYELAGVSLNGSIAGTWSPSKYVWVGTAKVEGAMKEIQTIIRALGIEDLDDRNVIIAGREYHSSTPGVVITYRGATSSYESNLIEERHTIDIMIFYSGAHTPQHDIVSGDNVTTIGLPNMGRQILAGLKRQKLSTTIAVLMPKTTAAPRQIKKGIYGMQISVEVRTQL